MEKFNINAKFNYKEGDEVNLIVISSLLNPYEEEISYTLYDRGVKEIKLEDFERFFIENIKVSSLLMSLKLSNNQERIRRFLNITTLSDELYIKIFNLYRFGDKDIFEDENRDVTISFIKRFFPKKSGYNHNEILFTPTNLIEIALTSTDPKVLNTLLKFKEFKVRQRGSNRPKNIREFISLNPNISPETKSYLFSLNDDRVDSFLALNPNLTKSEQLKLLQKNSSKIDINLAKNSNLHIDIFKELIKKEGTKEIALTQQKITKEHLKHISKSDFIHLASNPNLEDASSLIGESKEVDFAIASNPNLKSEDIKNLYSKYRDEIAQELSKNPNTPKELLEQFYKSKDYEIILNIASNPNTPKEIIRELFNRNDYRINRALAKNSNLEDDIIEYFKLDSSLLRVMSENENILQKIKSSKEYI